MGLAKTPRSLADGSLASAKYRIMLWEEREMTQMKQVPKGSQPLKINLAERREEIEDLWAPKMVVEL